MKSTLRELAVALALVSSMLVAVFLAYQVGREQELDIGSPYDGPFVWQFHEREANSEFTFRWTRPTSSIVLPALGIADWTGYIRLATPPVDRAWPLSLNGMAEQLGPGITVAELPQVRPDIWTGAWDVKLETLPFRPAGDPRDLGVAVDRIVVMTSSPVVWPPLTALVGDAALALWLYMSARLLRWNQSQAFMAGAICVVVLAGLSAWDRLNLYAIWPYLPLLLTVWSAMVLLLLLADRLVGLGQSQGRIAASVLVLQVIAASAYMLHPQAHIWDATFHVHRIEFVAAGQMAVPVISQEFGTRPIPYPPLSYLPLVPFYLLGIDPQVLIRVALTVVLFGIAWVLVLLSLRIGIAHGFTALTYALLPINVMVLSWGIYANLVGLLLALCLALYLAAETRYLKAWAMGAGSAMSHVSMLAIVPLWLFLAGIWRKLNGGRGARELIVAVAVVAASYALFYFLWTGQMADNLKDIVGRRTGTPKVLTLFAGGSVSDPGVGLDRTRVIVGGSSPPQDEPGFRTVLSGSAAEAIEIVLRGAYRELRAYLNVWPALLTPFGILVSAGINRKFVGIVMAAVASAVFFWAVGVTTGLFVRYFLFVAPFIALMAAACLAGLARRGLAGTIAVATLALYQLAQDMPLWAHRLLTVGH